MCVCTERLFDSLQFVYCTTKYFHNNSQKLEPHIFTLLLTPFAFKLVNYLRHSESLNIHKNFEIDGIFPSKTDICRFSNIFQRLTVPPIIDQFGRKRCQKKHKDVCYKLLCEFFQKYFVVHQWSAVKYSFSKYVCYDTGGLF